MELGSVSESQLRFLFKNEDDKTDFGSEKMCRLMMFLNVKGTGDGDLGLGAPSARALFLRLKCLRHCGWECCDQFSDLL